MKKVFGGHDAKRVSLAVRKAGMPPLLLFISLVVLGVTSLGQTRDYTRWVDPFIGTGGHGHTFPGATTPFGMVQLSPDTRTDNWDGSSGYHYSDGMIYGFSHTHLSGTGIPDYCDILLMPTLDKRRLFAKDRDKPIKGYASKFSHTNEKAEPGYYSVKLADDGIFAELTATPRVGLHRYTFSQAGEVDVIIDLGWRDRLLDSGYRAVGNNRIEGFRRSSSWAKDQTVFFVAEFSESIDGVFTENRPDISLGNNPKQSLDKDNRELALVFKTNSRTSGNRTLLVKVAISSISIEGARRNLAAELPGWDFDKVRADAKAAWNKDLSKIEVSGGTDAQMKTFYTALYHTMIQPNIFNDVDGSYLGHDRKVHNVSEDVSRKEAERQSLRNPRSKIQDPKLEQYTVFSLWDTFRAAHPLYTIIDQRRTVDFINTFIRQYEQGGRLPVWELWGNETDCMIGYHAVSVIADAMAKGIKGFDYEKAYEAAKHSAELDRDGLAAYKKRGYISSEDENESVSKTLEYAYDDWCIAQMAKIMGERHERWLLTVNKQLQGDLPQKRYAADYQRYSIRARSFENLFDPSTGFMRPKKNGGFVSPFAPNEVTFNFTEGNSWVYSFFVPQDITRLMELYGGHEKFAAKLDELFTTKDRLAGREQPDITGLIGQYAHGNEPSHHIAYLYDYAGQPWKTQKLVRQIMDEFYKPQPEGLIGNEDCGQMSAWYIMSASGVYEVTPGSGIYALGTPLFPEVKYNLENGKTFTIKANNVSAKNFYILNVKLNGTPYKKAFLTHEDLMKGGVLEFSMTDQPVMTAFTEFPVSGDKADFIAVPIIKAEGAYPVESETGDKSEQVVQVTLTASSQNSKIYYTTDGGIPDEKSTAYKFPFDIKGSAIVKAIAVTKTGAQSSVVETKITKKPNNWTVKIDSKYSRQYTGGGDEGLIDGIRGNLNFASGEWQGYQGQDLVATVDLQKETQILTLGAGFLQNARSWIWMPTHIEFELSTDGLHFDKAADIKTDVPPTQLEPSVRDYTVPIKPVQTRYVRIHAYNFGKIPAWHPGAGGEAYIFIDEILINPGINLK